MSKYIHFNNYYLDVFLNVILPFLTILQYQRDRMKKRCFNNVIQNGQVETDRQKEEPLKATKQLMSRLRTLEKQCGQLCDLEKPVAGGEDEFMGRVKAKVINKSHSI